MLGHGDLVDPSLSRDRSTIRCILARIYSEMQVFSASNSESTRIRPLLFLAALSSASELRNSSSTKPHFSATPPQALSYSPQHSLDCLRRSRNRHCKFCESRFASNKESGIFKSVEVMPKKLFSQFGLDTISAISAGNRTFHAETPRKEGEFT